MHAVSIVKHPEPSLRKKSIALNEIGREDRALISEMARVMYATKGIGLAAPQVGVSKRIIVFDSGSGLVKMVNPKIISRTGRASMEEGCLSVPQRSVNVKRAEEVKVSYMDENGKKRTGTFRGLSARVIQHEIDHINGKLIIDYLPWYRKIITRKGGAKCRL